MTPKEYSDSQDELERAKRKTAQMEGMLSARMKQLETELGTPSLTEAEKRAEKIRKEKRIIEKKHEQASQKFNEEFVERLRDV